MPDHTAAPGSVPEGRQHATLAAGTAVVATGLVVTGLGTLVMLALAARSMPGPEYADFVVWWTLATLLGTSFGVFEVYLARLLIAEFAAGRRHDVVTGLMLGRAGLMVGVLTLGLLVASPLLAEHLFSGAMAPALLLPVFMTLVAMQALQRGAATGRHDMVAIAGQLAVDGMARAVIVGALVATGADSIVSLSLGCCLAVTASLVVTGRRITPWLAAPRVRGSAVPVRPVLLLLVGTAGPLLANNGSVPWLRSLDVVSPHVLGAFAGAVTLSRIPTQFVSAVLSPLLAHLSASVENHDEAAFRHVRRRAEALTVGLGAAYIVAFAALGPLMLALLLGPEFTLGVPNLAVLAAASSGMFIAVVQQAALGALGRWNRVAVAWVAATFTFVIVLALPGEPLWRATLAPVVGVATALFTMWLLGRTRESSGFPRHPRG